AKYQHIAGQALLAPHRTEVAIAQDLRRGPGQARERMDRLFGLAFSDVSNSSIERHDTSDHQGVSHTAGQQGNTGSSTKKGYGEGRKLLQEHTEARTRHRFWWEIRAVALQTRLRCNMGKPGILRSIEGRSNCLGLHGMPGNLVLCLRRHGCPTYGATTGYRERRR